MRLACWCNRELLVAVDGPNGLFSQTIKHPFARVGSHESSDIVLPGAEIPPRTLYLHATPEGVFCHELAKLGAFYHGWLKPEQWISIGQYRLLVRGVGSEGAAMGCDTDLDDRESVAPPFPVLAFSADGAVISKMSIRRRLTLVGRRWPCNIHVTSKSISSPHCALYWDQGRLWVIDLLSRNGTVIKGRQITVGQLHPGSEAKLGRIKLTLLPFVIDSEPTLNPSRFSLNASDIRKVVRSDKGETQTGDAQTSESEQANQRLDQDQSDMRQTVRGAARATEISPQQAVQSEQLASAVDGQQSPCRRQTSESPTTMANEQTENELTLAKKLADRERAFWVERNRWEKEQADRERLIENQLKVLKEAARQLGKKRAEFETRRAVWKSEIDEAEDPQQRRAEAFQQEMTVAAETEPLQHRQQTSGNLHPAIAREQTERELPAEKSDAAEEGHDEASASVLDVPSIETRQASAAAMETAPHGESDLGSPVSGRLYTAPGVDDDFEGLMDRLTNRLIVHDREKRWRERLKSLFYASIVTLAVGAAFWVAWYYGWVPR